MTSASAPAPVPSDTKDWTWVLERPCPECGYTAEEIDPRGLPAIIRDLVPRWREVLGRGDVALRPEPERWSPLEYGAHVRDVNRVMDERLRLMLDEADPMFANWDQDATAVAERYDLQDPATVADELAEAAERLASDFARVGDDDWERPGRRSNGSLFTVTTLGRYYLHDVVHHLHDVQG